MSFGPSLRLISLQCGGKIDETVTRFATSTSASRSASSNDERRSLCTPTPLVNQIAFGTRRSCTAGKPEEPTGTGGFFLLFSLMTGGPRPLDIQPGPKKGDGAV